MKKMLSIILSLTFITLLSSCSEKEVKTVETLNPTFESTENFLKEDHTENTSNSLIYDIYSSELDRTITVSSSFTMKISSIWKSASQMNYGKEIIDGLFFRIDTKQSSEYSDNTQFVDNFIKSNSNWELYKNTNGIKFAFLHEEVNNSIEKERSIFKLYNCGSIYTIYIGTKSCDGLSLLSQKSIDNILNTVNLIENEPISTQELSKENTINKSLSFSGNGDTVTEKFKANGCTQISAEYTGDSTFIVTLYDSEGNFDSLVFSNFGAYSGEKVFKFEKDKMYMFEVTARNGNWKINIE